MGIINIGLVVEKSYSFQSMGFVHGYPDHVSTKGTSAKALAAHLALLAAVPSRRTRAFVGTGEVSVEATAEAGRGGRCTHLAAEVALAMLRGNRARRWAFVAMATDGVDGDAGGGAWVDGRSLPTVRRLDAAIAAFDTGGLWEDNGTLIPRRPTGNNLRDLWARVVEP